MSPKLQQLVDEALQLSPDERAEFVYRLRDSLGDFQNGDIESAWLDEAERRWQEIESGKVTCISADEALRRAHAALT